MDARWPAGCSAYRNLAITNGEEDRNHTRDRELLKIIERIHADSRGSYGSPLVIDELRLGLGEQVNRERLV
jgi:helix-turn-helix protein